MAAEKINVHRAEMNDPANKLKDFLYLCLDNWYWFILSLVVVMGIATVKILRTPPRYTRTATILIKETNVTRSRSDLESMLNMGGVSQMNSKLSNEIVAFRSPDLMREVVNKLKLNYSYYRDGRFHKNILYSETLPILLSRDDESSPMNCCIRPAGEGFEITGIEYRLDGSKVKDRTRYEGEFDTPVTTSAGTVTVSRGSYFEGEWNFPVYVECSTIAAATASCTGKLSTVALDQKNFSDLLQLFYSDQSSRRADDVLSNVIAVYNANWVDDRNKIAISTSMFINERLNSIEKDLGAVDSDISSFKSKNLMPDVAAVSSLYMTQSTELGKQVQDMETQISTSRYIRNYLTTKVSGTQLIPVPAGLSDAAIVAQINSYNTLLMQRNSMVAGSSESNPLVVEMDGNLDAMRLAICESVDNQIEALQARLQSLRRTEEKATSRLADNPNQAKYLLSVERRQKVMESLYLYLLQKREENELSQAFTAYNTRVITSPTAASAPPFPDKRKIWLFAFLLAIAIPVVVLYVVDALNTTIRGRRDLEDFEVPFLGEIPSLNGRRMVRHSHLHPENEEYKLVVKHGKRNSVNEAFRVVRTNLEFMNRNSGSKVIAITSFNPGSGKTFITLNIGAAFAIKSHRVLVIDGDFRRASLSSFAGSPVSGFADYLSGVYDEISRVIVKDAQGSGFDVLPVGTIPPNPSELIGSDAFTKALEELSEKYDFIFIDCPPVDMVADAKLINRHVDRTVFVLRAGLMERAFLPDLEQRYNDGSLAGLAVILNGTQENTHRKYYAYGYGYANAK